MKYRNILLPVCLAVSLTGCASMFEADIQKKLRQGDLTVVDCNTDSKTPIKPQLSARSMPVLAGLERLQLPDIGAAGTDNLKAGQIVLNAAAADPKLNRAMSALVRVNLAEFSGEAAFVDQNSLATAKVAHDQLKAAGLANGPDSNSWTITKDQYDKLLQAVATATAASGWTAELTESLGGLTRAIKAYQLAYTTQANKPATHDDFKALEATAVGTAVIQSLRATQETSTFAAYFKAYFRNGEIFEVKFDDTGLQTKLVDTIKKEIQNHGGTVDQTLIDKLNSEIKAVNGDFQDKLCKKGASDGSCTILGAIGEQTFVTRAGKSYGFPGVTAVFDPTANKKVSTNKLNTNDILKDLLRVLIEATGDAVPDPVPGVANSTLCKELTVCAAAGDKGIQLANDIGDETEAATSEVVSIVIRGGWLFSLNNEAAADAITVGTSVTLRKVAERIAYAQGAASCPKPGHRNVKFQFAGP